MPKPARPRVLLTYSRSLMALTAAQSLADHDIDVVGCDSVDMTVLQFSKHSKGHRLIADHREDPEAFIEDLLEAVEHFRPKGAVPYVLMPMFEETSVIAEHAARFEGKIILAIPDWASITQVEPKDRLPAAAEAAGVAFPKTLAPKTREAVEAATRELAFPVITKPARGVGGRGIAKHDDAKALLAHIDEKPPKTENDWPLLQEAVPGRDFCFCALCEDGEVRAHMTYRSVHGFPPRSGAGVLRETVESAPFLKAAAPLLKHLKWNGVCEIDYRWTGEDDAPAQLIEVNPRYWAGLFQSVASGVDFPWLLYRQAVGDPVTEPPRVTIGRKSKVPLLALLSASQKIAEQEEYFQNLSGSWDALRGRDEERGERGRAAGALGGFVTSLFDVRALGAYAKAFRESREDHDEAATDFIPLDDPGAMLGVLFVLSSLIRRGELPPELKFDG
ncbi:ATP-grasp domain-containing protein [Glycocaulis profundi]|nr:ATP-grasp domain-containing protein [Glycocaulis profundi]